MDSDVAGSRAYSWIEGRKEGRKEGFAAAGTTAGVVSHDAVSSLDLEKRNG